MKRTTNLLVATGLMILPISAFAQSSVTDAKPAEPVAGETDGTMTKTQAVMPKAHVKTLKTNHGTTVPTGIQMKAPDQSKS